MYNLISFFGILVLLLAFLGILSLIDMVLGYSGLAISTSA